MQSTNSLQRRDWPLTGTNLKQLEIYIQQKNNIIVSEKNSTRVPISHNHNNETTLQLGKLRGERKRHLLGTIVPPEFTFVTN